MNRNVRLVIGFVVCLCLASEFRTVDAQQLAPRAWASNVIVPQSYRSSAAISQPLRVTNITARVTILEQIATTTLNIHLKNTGTKRETAEFLLPVPDGAAIRAFTFQGAGSEPSAELLTKERAKATFDSIVKKLKDPRAA
ncbi:MAG: hypothetical protein H8E66_02455 [Planctomycetes bacterium]|nr:hypothetical protein [Planctomycetota bacterium]